MAAWLLSSCTELASSAKAQWTVCDSAVSNQKVKRGEMIIDRIFNAAESLDEMTGQISSESR